MRDVLIRECTFDDIDEVCQLDVQWAEEGITHGFIPSSREEFIDEWLNPAKSYFLVADMGGCVVGYINGSVHVSKGSEVIPEGERYLEIDNVYVKATFPHIFSTIYVSIKNIKAYERANG